MIFELYRNLNRIKNRHIKSVTLKIFPTWICNLDCSYCSRHFIESNYHHKKEIQITPGEWIDKIVKFPIPIDIVSITGGGEPFLYKGITELINRLIELKYCIRLYSNLYIRRELPSSGRLFITTTLHRPEISDRIWENVKYYRSKGIAVEVTEFDTSLRSELNVKVKGKKTNKMGLILKGSKGWYQCLYNPYFCCAPDGTLFTKQHSLFTHYREKGGGE